MRQSDSTGAREGGDREELRESVEKLVEELERQDREGAGVRDHRGCVEGCARRVREAVRSSPQGQRESLQRYHSAGENVAEGDLSQGTFLSFLAYSVIYLITYLYILLLYSIIYIYI